MGKVTVESTVAAVIKHEDMCTKYLRKNEDIDGTFELSEDVKFEYDKTFYIDLETAKAIVKLMTEPKKEVKRTKKETK